MGPIQNRLADVVQRTTRQRHSPALRDHSWVIGRVAFSRLRGRVDWIQEDIHITRNLVPLAHTIPTSFPQLTAADIEIVNYLQDQGLWGHNVSNRSAREVVNLSSLAAQSSRLVHIVKWMQRYGDTPPETAEHGAEREMSRGAEHGAEHEGEMGNMQVRGAEHERNAAEVKTQGKRNIAPP